tara:strand:+ start:862 stop:1638 length:777 start_codon:yes stop_codon:yes gene_type:complete
MQVFFTATDKVERIELKSKQIPSTAQSVLCGALADGAWSNLKAISLIGHQLLESTADAIIEATKTRERCGFFGADTKVKLDATILQPADIKLMASTLTSGVELRSLSLQVCTVHRVLAHAHNACMGRVHGVGIMCAWHRRSLKLQGCELGPAAMEALSAGLAQHTSLAEIDLNGNPLGNGGAVALAAGLSKNKSVKVITMEYCDVGDEGAAAMGAMLEVNECLANVSMPMTSSFAPHWMKGDGNDFHDGSVALVHAAC